MDMQSTEFGIMDCFVNSFSYTVCSYLWCWGEGLYWEAVEPSLAKLCYDNFYLSFNAVIFFFLEQKLSAYFYLVMAKSV